MFRNTQVQLKAVQMNKKAMRNKYMRILKPRGKENWRNGEEENDQY